MSRRSNGALGRVLAGALLVVVASACANTSRWQTVRRLDEEDVESILASADLALGRDERPEEVPRVPERRRLRPCCAFGTDLRVRLGSMALPGFVIGNVRSPDDIGRHTYDAGRRGSDQLIGSERNGLVYTCRGGFIDTAHVRDYADWTLFLATQLGRRFETGGVIELSDAEAGKRRFVLSPIDPEYVRATGRRNLAAAMAVWAGYQMSIWHEIATWYGWSSIELFSERASAFSPEDLYSNLLGAKIAGAIVSSGNDLSEPLFNRAVDDWFAQSLAFLGAVPEKEGIAALQAVDGRWWRSDARLPDANLVIRRSVQHGLEVAPWLAPPEATSCESTEPHVLKNPSRLPMLDFRLVLRFEVALNAELRAHPAFADYRGVVTDADFPELLERIRQEVVETFGPEADQP